MTCRRSKPLRRLGGENSGACIEECHAHQNRALYIRDITKLSSPRQHFAHSLTCPKLKLALNVANQPAPQINTLLLRLKQIKRF